MSIDEKAFRAAIEAYNKRCTFGFDHAPRVCMRDALEAYEAATPIQPDELPAIALLRKEILDWWGEQEKLRAIYQKHPGHCFSHGKERDAARAAEKQWSDCYHSPIHDMMPKAIALIKSLPSPERESIGVDIAHALADELIGMTETEIILGKSILRNNGFQVGSETIDRAYARKVLQNRSPAFQAYEAAVNEIEDGKSNG